MSLTKLCEAVDAQTEFSHGELCDRSLAYQSARASACLPSRPDTDVAVLRCRRRAAAGRPDRAAATGAGGNLLALPAEFLALRRRAGKMSAAGRLPLPRLFIDHQACDFYLPEQHRPHRLAESVLAFIWQPDRDGAGETHLGCWGSQAPEDTGHAAQVVNLAGYTGGALEVCEGYWRSSAREQARQRADHTSMIRSRRHTSDTSLQRAWCQGPEPPPAEEGPPRLSTARRRHRTVFLFWYLLLGDQKPRRAPADWCTLFFRQCGGERTRVRGCTHEAGAAASSGRSAAGGALRCRAERRGLIR